jgi:hypothetical protein
MARHAEILEWLLVPLLVWTASGCRTLQIGEAESFGLPLVELRVKSEDEAVLNSTTWEKTPVGADVRIEGQESRADLKYAGKSSLDDFKKNFEIRFRGADNYKGRSEIRLSSQAVDPSGLRSLLGFWAYQQGGVPASAIDPVALYLNSRYRGLYFHIENVDEQFFAARGISRGTTYKAILGNADFGERTLKAPDSAFDFPMEKESYAVIIRLCELVLANGDVTDKLEQLSRIVDARALLDYLAVSVAIKHFDGFSNNYYFYLDKGPGRYRVIPWDLDRILEADSVEFVPGSSVYGDNHLILLLLQAPEHKKYYLETLQTLLRGALTPALIGAKLAEFKETIRAAWDQDRVLTARGRSLDGEADEVLRIYQSWYQLVSADVESELAKFSQGQP